MDLQYLLLDMSGFSSCIFSVSADMTFVAKAIFSIVTRMKRCLLYWSEILKHEDPWAWSLSDLQDVGGFIWACRRSHCDYLSFWNCCIYVNEHVLVEMLKKLDLSCALNCILLSQDRIGPQWESGKLQRSCCANIAFTLKWNSRKLLQFKDTSSINFKGDQAVKSCYALLTALRSAFMNIPGVFSIADHSYTVL